jgi:NAD(P)-dependent dehydrogenase (short-subunit alcohol dehydrogenase family)
LEKLLAVNEELLDGKCPMIGGIDFLSPQEAGEKMTAELKGETLHGLAYAVGSITLKPIRGCKVSDFMDSYTLNVAGAAMAVKACLPGLKKGAISSSSSLDEEDEEDKIMTSSIVFFSSIAARHGLANHAVIGSSKAAIEGLTVSLAAELAASSIRVNCVAPSLTGGGSEMASKMTSNAKMAAALAAAHPIPRLGMPNDSANAATYLLDHGSSSWTTGAIIPVDGGRSTILR